MRRTLLFVAIAGAALSAQDPVWRLPERGAVEYRRQLRCVSGTADKKKSVRTLDCDGALPAAFRLHLAPMPWLCAGELDPDRVGLRAPPRDLRDILRHVAFDLDLGRRPKLVLPRQLPFGDLHLAGKRLDVTETGQEQFEFTIKTKPPAVRGEERKGDVRRFFVPRCKFDAEGTLVVSRQYDAGQGVVRAFTATLSLWFEEKPRSWRKIVIADQWDLVGVHENQDAAFRAAVAAAITGGRKWLHKELSTLTRRHLVDGQKNRSYGSGRIALGLLALLHAEVPADDPVIVAGFAELGRREIKDTYSLGIALMAMAARYAPPGEVDMIRSGVLTAPRPRELPAAEKKLAAAWLSRLRRNVDTRVDEAYRLRFNYVAARRWDNSVNQYGLLGLHAAELCQLEVPVTVWRAAAAHLLAVQGPSEGQQRLTLTSYRQRKLEQTGAGGTRASGPKVEVRGWSYQDPSGRPACGAMTTAGLTGLVLARAGMIRHDLEKADVMPDVLAATNAGFAWLDANFDVRSNPGNITRAGHRWLYYMYGLERACELAGVALLGDRDWYYEGALQIMAHQRKAGSWPAEQPGAFQIEATCFAILYLKKATLPAITGR